ncbi:MAG: hypothetical protein ACYTBP_17705 [Planctomycetota bacterium]|jgi:hypothetical protein
MDSDWKIIGPLVGAVVGLFGWLAKHISNIKKHPCKDDIVFQDVCAGRGKANEQAHENLKESIKAAVDKSNEQHKDLKADMNQGFRQLETLRKNEKHNDDRRR